MPSPETKIVFTDSQNNAEVTSSPKETVPDLAEGISTPKETMPETGEAIQEANPDIENKCFNANSKSPISFNPNLPEGEENDVLERLRGDAIGTTLYSERFVISTLLKLREMKESLESDENFERDLEALWDMTIEEDVVVRLIDLDVYEVFTESIVKYEEDYRLIEILVGIIGNMCAVSGKAVEHLCKSDTTVEILIHLTACGDSCVLIQLMRLITTIYGNIESATIWNDKMKDNEEFAENFCFILFNSNNQLLLSHALEALNAILAKCATMDDAFNNDIENDGLVKNSTFLTKFGQSNVSIASIEAFQTIYNKETNEEHGNEPDEFLDTESFTESLKKSFVTFLQIHDIFLNYARDVYSEDSVEKLPTCFNIILNNISKPNFVLPSNIDYLLDVLECFISIYMASPSLQNEESILCTINLWWILKQHIDVKSNGNKESLSDFEKDDSDLHESFKELYDISEELLSTLLRNCNESALTDIFKLCKTEQTQEVLKAFGVKIDDYNVKEIRVYCKQLDEILNSHRK